MATWRTYYFRQFPGEQWEGTTTQLMIELQKTEELGDLLPLVVRDVRTLGRGLNKLIAQPTPWLTKRRTTQRLYAIHRPDPEPVKGKERRRKIESRRETDEGGPGAERCETNVERLELSTEA